MLHSLPFRSLPYVMRSASDTRLVIEHGERRQTAIATRRNQLSQALATAKTECDLMSIDSDNAVQKEKAVDAVNVLKIVVEVVAETVISMATEFSMVNTRIQATMDSFVTQNEEFFASLRRIEPRSEPRDVERLHVELRDASPRLGQMLSIFYDVLSVNIQKGRNQLMALQALS